MGLTVSTLTPPTRRIVPVARGTWATVTAAVSSSRQKAAPKQGPCPQTTDPDHKSSRSPVVCYPADLDLRQQMKGCVMQDGRLSQSGNVLLGSPLYAPLNNPRSSVAISIDIKMGWRRNGASNSGPKQPTEVIRHIKMPDNDCLIGTRTVGL